MAKETNVKQTELEKKIIYDLPAVIKKILGDDPRIEMSPEFGGFTIWDESVNPNRIMIEIGNSAGPFLYFHDPKYLEVARTLVKEYQGLVGENEIWFDSYCDGAHL